MSNNIFEGEKAMISLIGQLAGGYYGTQNIWGLENHGDFVAHITAKTWISVHLEPSSAKYNSVFCDHALRSESALQASA